MTTDGTGSPDRDRRHCNKKKTPLASKKKDNRKEGSAKKDQAHSTTVNPFFFSESRNINMVSI